MSLSIRICFGLLAVVSTAHAWTTNQLMQLEYRLPTIALEWSARPPLTFWERFESAFDKNSSTIFIDRFHPLSTMQWNLDVVDLEPEDFSERTGHTARQALARSIRVSAREAALHLPIVMWLEDRQGFLVDLLLNSMDAVEEESVSPLDPSYRVIEQSWWQRLSESKNLRFGLRPFRTSPYAFMSASIWNGDSLVMLAHVRYHYSHFADHRLEVALSFPLSHGLSLDVGTAYQFGNDTEDKKIVVKISKQLGNGGIVHVGMEAQDHPRLLAGISMPL